MIHDDTFAVAEFAAERLRDTIARHRASGAPIRGDFLDSDIEAVLDRLDGLIAHVDAWDDLGSRKVQAVTMDPILAAQFHRATVGAAAHRLRLSLSDTSGRNTRVVAHDDLRIVLDDYDILAQAWEAAHRFAQAQEAAQQDPAATASLPALREVTQSLLVGNEHGFPGDCIRASVASLLDMDPAVVPHFVCADDVRVWGLALTAFAAEHGWSIERRLFDSEHDQLPDFGIAIGTTTRPAASHAVVVRGGEMVWDPHPSRDGLVEVKQASSSDWPRIARDAKVSDDHH